MLDDTAVTQHAAQQQGFGDDTHGHAEEPRENFWDHVLQIFIYFCGYAPTSAGFFDAIAGYKSNAVIISAIN